VLLDAVERGLLRDAGHGVPTLVVGPRCATTS
jgi:hypothetical protein